MLMCCAAVLFMFDPLDRGFFMRVLRYRTGRIYHVKTEISQ